ncbi:lysophospholipid acyltransferase family protein [Saccharomonospora piscinae]|uniref:lysophospholipid acyltransferase family protein n=1 Tax=Saccharomonospora piscinae TaxID=687388 RepID=UPI000462FD58|nr:lysophospholipid acyltransferase family protein [Saccharomonospora piscinae]
MNPYRAFSPCTPDCARHAEPPVSPSTAARRAAELAAALARGGPLPQRARSALAALGVALDVRAEAGGQATLSVPGSVGTLVVANHQSWLDVVGLTAVEGVRFLAKREIARWPWVSSVARRHGTVFVDRWALRTLPDAVAALRERLRSGHSVVVFPEATTHCAAPGGRFRHAAFQAALDAGAPVRPVSLSYHQRGRPSRVAAFVGDDTLAHSLGRVLRARELTLRLTSHPALAPDGDRARLARQAREAVLGREPARA